MLYSVVSECRWRMSVIETYMVRANGWLIPSRAVSELYPFNEHETRFVAGLESVEANVGGKTTLLLQIISP